MKFIVYVADGTGWSIHRVEPAHYQYRVRGWWPWRRRVPVDPRSAVGHARFRALFCAWLYQRQFPARKIRVVRYAGNLATIIWDGNQKTDAGS